MIEACAKAHMADSDREHTVKPAMVYLSQSTELGTLYSLAELTDISGVCKKCGLLLFVDGARLAYALACGKNDVKLSDLARLTDAFYIGGTKCGALFPCRNSAFHGAYLTAPQPNPFDRLYHQPAHAILLRQRFAH